ncbi:MAG: RNA methyltransferase [candidate division WOR-3 bacterium]|nr:RNA methyltransferase [candidate division WOR-3 bacterium]MCX7947286.1 RNA methyltransferase [candidate division WOR-3 bacterium]MDW8150157.1 RNA methyltransferase [candidate division WOR-3 bacterium]
MKLVGIFPYLYKLENPQNCSAIVRTADAVGIEKVYITEDKPFVINEKISKGSHKWVRIEIVEEPMEFLLDMKKQEYKIVATSLSENAINYRNYNYNQKTIIIFGNESKGIDKEILDLSDVLIKIPQYGKVQSLNVSVAFGIIFYWVDYVRRG